jgi:NADH-quinone oxidoreductase subunit F
MLRQTNYITKNYGKERCYDLDVYEAQGGYRAARRALAMSREAVVAEVTRAHIRGRGGAGFDCGMKWSFMPKESNRPHYLVVNADEGEPGTFKDRTIMEQNPHLLLEGCIIGAHAIGARDVFIYVRHELHLAKARLRTAIEQATKRGFLGERALGHPYPVRVWVHTGAGAYICGEETALLESLEGKRGEPRLRPPFPAQSGAFGCPTSVNNVETVSAVVIALELGGDAFSQLSELHRFNDGGVRLFGVSGHVKRPGIYEAAIGLTLRELVYELGGGVLGDRALLGVIPGGSSCPILLPSETVDLPHDPRFAEWQGKSVLDLPMGVDTFRNVGTMLGTCCAIVLSDAADPVQACRNLVQFYAHESCGQCTPCREGCGWLDRLLDKIVRGQACMEELNLISEVASNITGNTICAFGDGAAGPVLAFVRKFRKSFEDYILNGGQNQTRRLVP